MKALRRLVREIHRQGGYVASRTRDLDLSSVLGIIDASRLAPSTPYRRRSGHERGDGCLHRLVPVTSACEIRRTRLGEVRLRRQSLVAGLEGIR
jgi:hypothetical protein